MSEGVTERHTIILRGGPYDGLVVSRTKDSGTTDLLVPSTIYHESILYSYRDGEMRYVGD